MDRDHAREELLLLMLDSKTNATTVRGVLDVSAFAQHAALATLLADHDVHHPAAPSYGPGRRASVAAYLLALADAAAARQRPGPSPHDPRWGLVADARASLGALPMRNGTTADIGALLEAFSERRVGTTPPPLPHPAGPSRRRRRDSWHP